MLNLFNRFLDATSEYLAHRKGLLPGLGILFVMINFVLQFLPVGGVFVQANVLLHLGIVLAILGIMLAWAL